MMDAELLALTDALARNLMDRGKLMEAGWYLYRRHHMPADAGSTQIAETRKAFYSGAQHVFASLTRISDQGEEPTEADLSRVDRLAAELDAFSAEFMKTKGRA